jgi:hypothetical protein
MINPSQKWIPLFCEGCPEDIHYLSPQSVSRYNTKHISAAQLTHIPNIQLKMLGRQAYLRAPQTQLAQKVIVLTHLLLNLAKRVTDLPSAQ